MKKVVTLGHTYKKKKTSIGNGTHSKLPSNKRSTRKKYRGQGR